MANGVDDLGGGGCFTGVSVANGVDDLRVFYRSECGQWGG